MSEENDIFEFRREGYLFKFRLSKANVRPFLTDLYFEWKVEGIWDAQPFNNGWFQYAKFDESEQLMLLDSTIYCEDNSPIAKHYPAPKKDHPLLFSGKSNGTTISAVRIPKKIYTQIVRKYIPLFFRKSRMSIL